MQPIDHEGYSRVADGNTLLRELNRRLHEKRFKQAKLGDVVALRDYTTTYHVGILVDHPQHEFGLIHAWSPRGKVTEHGLFSHYRERVVKCFAFPGCHEV